MISPRVDTVLQRAPAIRLELSAGETVRLIREGRHLTVGGHVLAILDTFAHPRTFADGLAALRQRTKGMHDWMALTGTVCRLFAEGFLQDLDARQPEVGRDTGFASAAIHIRMLEDQARTQIFQKAIRAMVRPGDVVVDIGTGTGVLAVTAAQAGARHVYAVEASAIGGAAQAVFQANGLAARITLVPGWSTRIELPERADVLVSEIIGDHPLDEDVLEIYADAHRRLLKPQARVIPSLLRLMVLPVTVPAEYRERFLFTPSHSDKWQLHYGIDFSPLSCLEAAVSRQTFIAPQSMRDWARLGEPAGLVHYDLNAAPSRRTTYETNLVLTQAGRFDGVLLYVEMDLAPGICLSLHPAATGESNHWRMPLWLLQPGFTGAPGQNYHIRCREPEELVVEVSQLPSPKGDGLRFHLP